MKKGKLRKWWEIDMWKADKWKDYELIDASDGERLERWGDYILIRPDPQIIWSGLRKDKSWSKAHGIYKRSKSGGGRWVVNDMPDKWTVKYGNLEFMLRPMGFKHTGLFPEQATNWEWFSEIICKHNSENNEKYPRVLNLFAYTGGATGCCSCCRCRSLPR